MPLPAAFGSTGLNCMMAVSRRCNTALSTIVILCLLAQLLMVAQDDPISEASQPAVGAAVLAEVQPSDATASPRGAIQPTAQYEQRVAPAAAPGAARQLASTSDAMPELTGTGPRGSKEPTWNAPVVTAESSVEQSSSSSVKHAASHSSGRDVHVVVGADRVQWPGVIGVINSIRTNSAAPERLQLHLLATTEQEGAFRAYLKCHQLDPDEPLNGLVSRAHLEPSGHVTCAAVCNGREV